MNRKTIITNLKKSLHKTSRDLKRSTEKEDITELFNKFCSIEKDIEIQKAYINNESK